MDRLVSLLVFPLKKVKYASPLFLLYSEKKLKWLLTRYTEYRTPVSCYICIFQFPNSCATFQLLDNSCANQCF